MLTKDDVRQIRDDAESSHTDVNDMCSSMLTYIQEHEELELEHEDIKNEHEQLEIEHENIKNEIEKLRDKERNNDNVNRDIRALAVYLENVIIGLNSLRLPEHEQKDDKRRTS